jgi:hypothetical protein
MCVCAHRADSQSAELRTKVEGVVVIVGLVVGGCASE